MKRYAPNVVEGRVRYIHNAVDTNRFKPGERPPPNNLLYVGRVNKKKGVEDLIHAMHNLVQRFPSAKLSIIGSDPTGGAYIEQVKELAHKLGVDKNIIFVGSVPNREMPSYYQKANVFLFASHGGEGIPRSILEAMACGVPVVATEIAGIPEAVKEGVTGFLVSPRDPQSIAEKTALILGNQNLRARLGTNARQLIEKEFSWEKVISRIIDVFKEVGSKQKGRDSSSEREPRKVILIRAWEP